jgi:5-methyltetrahydrofolate--homocysteine methyltransferase
MSLPSLTIIGERINSSRKTIARAIDERDEEFIRREARMQLEAGATFLDVNAGTYPDREAEILSWLARTAQASPKTSREAALSIDSANPAVLKAALEVNRGRALINSITLERKNMDAILPLALEHSSAVIAQTLESGQMPSLAQDKADIAFRLFDTLTKAGIEAADIYIDPVVQPVSMVAEAGVETLRAFSMIRKQLPDVHLLCGVGNVSFQLPGRTLLDRTFLPMAIAAGADTAIIDPCNRDIMASVAAAEALLGKDDFCMRYITAHRSGMFESI